MTGISLVGKQISRAGGDLVLFDRDSQEYNSPIFDVTDYSYIIQAYGLVPGEKVTVNSVYVNGNALRETVFAYNGDNIELTSENPTALIAISGKYRAILDGSLGNAFVCLLPQKHIVKNGLTAKPHGEKNVPSPLISSKSTNKKTVDFMVTDKPYTFTAFGLELGEKIRVLSVYIANGQRVEAEYKIGGIAQELDISNTSLVIDRSGTYLLELIGNLGQVLLIARPNYVSYSDPYLSRGLPGQPGPPGPAGAAFEFVQNTPALIWNINHNLGYRPSVELLTVGGVEFNSNVVHINTDTVQVINNLAIAGRARLN